MPHHTGYTHSAAPGENSAGSGGGSGVVGTTPAAAAAHSGSGAAPATEAPATTAAHPCETEADDNAALSAAFNGNGPPTCAAALQAGACSRQSPFFDVVSRHCGATCGICITACTHTADDTAGLAAVANANVPKTCAMLQDEGACHESSPNYRYAEAFCQTTCRICDAAAVSTTPPSAEATGSGELPPTEPPLSSVRSSPSTPALGSGDSDSASSTAPASTGVAPGSSATAGTTAATTAAAETAAATPTTAARGAPGLPASAPRARATLEKGAAGGGVACMLVLADYFRDGDDGFAKSAVNAVQWLRRSQRPEHAAKLAAIKYADGLTGPEYAARQQRLLQPRAAAAAKKQLARISNPAVVAALATLQQKLREACYADPEA